MACRLSPQEGVWVGGCAEDRQVVLRGSPAMKPDAGLTLLGDDIVVCGLHATGMSGAGFAIQAGRNNVLFGNRATGNVGPGILIGGPQSPRRAVVRDNIIGADGAGDLLGNCTIPGAIECAGLIARDARDAVVGGNTIVDTTGPGVLLTGTGGGHELSGNFIGEDLLGVVAPNRGHGVVDRTVRSGSMVNVVRNNDGSGLSLEGRGHRAFRNELAANLGYGVFMADGTDGNTLSQNVVSQNAAGPIRLEGNANGDLAPPAVVYNDGTDIRGVVRGPVAPPGQLPPMHGAGTIEVFAGFTALDADLFLASFRVRAEEDVWNLDRSTLVADDPTHPVLQGDYAVTVTFTEDATGATSALSELCDGLNQDADEGLDELTGGLVPLIDEDFDWDGDGVTTCGDKTGVKVDGESCDPQSLGCLDCWDDNDTVQDDFDGDLVGCRDDTCDGDDTVNCTDEDNDGFVTNKDACKNVPVTYIACPASCIRCGEEVPVGEVRCPVFCVDEASLGGAESIIELTTLEPGDPDDNDPCVFPKAEICNGLDDDYDGRTDEPFDQDGDGYAKAPLDPRLIGDGYPVAPFEDCDDLDARRHPGAVEVCGDGIDRDCDLGVAVEDDDIDADGDGFSPHCISLQRGLDPDDSDPAEPPDAEEDNDGDGETPAQGDCDDDNIYLTSQTCTGACPSGTYGPVDSPVVVCGDPAQIEELQVVVNADGSFTPQLVWMDPDDTIVWIFPAADPASGHPSNDSIVAVDPVSLVADPDDPSAVGALCLAYRPFGDPLDLTGPSPRLASGVFVMGETDRGLEEEHYDAATDSWQRADGSAACCPTSIGTTAEAPDGTFHRLCATGEPRSTMLSTYEDPAVTGVFLRLSWRDLEPREDVYDWTDVDREVQRAVDHGKLYSVVISSRAGEAPGWLLEGVESLQVQDSYDKDACGNEFVIANPLDPAFQEHYNDLLSALAAHLKQKSAWYRALTYVKLGGTNTVTDELRVPRTCKEGCDVCNTEVLALADHAYTPAKIGDFYEQELDHIRATFPGKQSAFMLIQDTFPKVGESGGVAVWQTCELPLQDPEVCPGTILSPAVPGDELKSEHQLEDILARTHYVEPDLEVCSIDVVSLYNGPGDCAALATDLQTSGCVVDEAQWQLVVQHNGMRAKPGNGNDWVKCAAELGRPTAFQTGNATETVYSPETLQVALDSTFDAGAFVFESYEVRLWEASKEGVALDLPSVCTDTGAIESCEPRVPAQLALHELRLALAETHGWLEDGAPLADPFPSEHRFTPDCNTGDCDADRRLHYVNGRACDRSAPSYGVIGIRGTGPN